MNNDMPWVNLTQEEVEELRNKKYELTEYGKQRLRELAKEGISKYNEALQLMRNQEPYPDEMFEVAERREKSNRVLQRYNDFYNMECAGLPHGTPITPEHQQMITLQCMIDALRCENLNREYNEIEISDIEDLISRLDEQATTFLEKVRKNNEI
jgi:deoxyadenosine/deoxycytidine kinase